MDMHDLLNQDLGSDGAEKNTLEIDSRTRLNDIYSLCCETNGQVAVLTNLVKSLLSKVEALEQLVDRVQESTEQTRATYRICN